jgi:hypothetical protein
MTYFEKGDVWNAFVNIKESLKGGNEIKEHIKAEG